MSFTRASSIFGKKKKKKRIPWLCTALHQISRDEQSFVRYTTTKRHHKLIHKPKPSTIIVILIRPIKSGSRFKKTHTTARYDISHRTGKKRSHSRIRRLHNKRTFSNKKLLLNQNAIIEIVTPPKKKKISTTPWAWAECPSCCIPIIKSKGVAGSLWP